jgi:hypothetical protein
MSQLKTPQRVRFFEAASLLVMALTGIWFVGLMVYAEARHRGVL